MRSTQIQRIKTKATKSHAELQSRVVSVNNQAVFIKLTDPRNKRQIQACEIIIMCSCLFYYLAISYTVGQKSICQTPILIIMMGAL